LFIAGAWRLALAFRVSAGSRKVSDDRHNLLHRPCHDPAGIHRVRGDLGQRASCMPA